MPTLCITGVAGLIGSRFCDYILQNADIQIIGIDNFTGGMKENLPKSDRFLFIEADLSTKAGQTVILEQIKELSIDYIFHFAATAWEGLSPFMRLTNYNNNLLATAFMINIGITKSVKRFVFTSSMAVYGRAEPPFDESLVPCPIDPYGIAKYACEMDIQVAHEQHGMEYCIIRPHNVYGKNQNIFDPYRNVLGRWMYQALTNTPFTVYGDGKQTRAFTYIDDCLLCLWKAAIDDRAKNQIINLGGTREINLNEAASILCEVTETPHRPIYLEARHEVKHAWSTYQKSIDLLDYKETVDLREGLRRMWNDVKCISLKPLKFYDEYEVSKGIYSFWK